MSGISIYSQPAVTTNNASSTASQATQDDAMMYIHICLNITLRLAISAVGVLTNLINTIIFSQLGLKDSMSVELFSLSISDFLAEILQVASCVFYVIDLLYPNVDPSVWLLCYYVLGWAMNSTLSMSSWITAMVSLQQCLCVVFPFKAKEMFTRCRCLAAIMSMQFIHITLGLIYLYDKVRSAGSSVSSIDMNLCKALGSNCTAPLSTGSTTYTTTIDLVAGLSVSLVLQVVVITSAIWMGYSLQVSSRVRLTSSDLTPQVTIRVLSNKFTETMSHRERRLVKVVMSLAIILTVCNAPQIISALAYHLVPGMNSEEQKYLSSILWAVTHTFGSLGCSSHFVVYLRLNRNYRRQFQKSFGLGHMTS